ncbi:hypothetical protein BKG71_16625 [Mycobacteroides chelonae]|jgi:hypothetical protein|uniref:Uncharacterized protein n=1 Tax=Mycobacteroides chelonae TaxID=1774 RepID=A0AB73MAS8_MYCCH|nr:hypothetical protein AOT86_11820 [Mycobacteroides sp. H072]KRQ32685.1 hypothetical protein AOT84_21090 [Mycobacteroides sp. H002]KRQ54111.1 hypothetical protein AOT85_05590 [Mycobacteroides sp. H054]KRQ67948.1 hypothetical protein AOT83_18630 [Mycobacteroides sp. H001]OHT48800.1 hypothetical protein BKG63_21830 [Mycobacteroides chelonae]
MHLSHSTDGVSSGPEANAGEASLMVHRSMPLDALHDEAAHHRVLAQQQGITYDGWSDDDVGCGGVVPVRASVIG